jgi:hypothetical protein
LWDLRRVGGGDFSSSFLLIIFNFFKNSVI